MIISKLSNLWRHCPSLLLHQSHHIGANGPDPRVTVRRWNLHLLDIDADDHPALLERTQVLARHLEPRAGGAAEVEDGGAGGDELVLLLYLDQLERGAGDVAEALRLAVEEVGGAARAAHGFLSGRRRRR